MAVKFYYDHKSHWITDNVNSKIPVAVGSFQHTVGCPGDWDPSCLRSWLQDADGDGTYAATLVLPAGSFEAKVALNETWDENYGAGGVPGGANIPFAVSAQGPITFSYNSTTHVLTISGGTLADTDGDGVADTIDACPGTTGTPVDANGCSRSQVDSDADGVCNPGKTSTLCSGSDNCPSTANANQADGDHDGIGNVCDSDAVAPVSRNQCQDNGWKNFYYPRSFKNAGDCLQYVNTGR
jgi:hypothetical protein